MVMEVVVVITREVVEDVAPQDEDGVDPVGGHRHQHQRIGRDLDTMVENCADSVLQNGEI